MTSNAGNGSTLSPMTQEPAAGFGRCAAYLFVLCATLYLLTFTDQWLFLSDVGYSRSALVRAMVDHGSLAIPPEVGLQGADGRAYSCFGIGTPLLAIPLYLAAKLLKLHPETCIALLNPLLSAATVVLLLRLGLAVGYRLRTALVVSLAYAVGSMAWFVAKAPGDHAAETFCILLAITCLVERPQSRHPQRLLVIAGCAAGFACLIRPTGVLALPALALLLIIQERQSQPKRLWQTLATLVAVLLPFAALLLGYNALRFGSPWQSGHSLLGHGWGIDYFSGTPLLDGLYGLLASPGKSYFLYTPLALLAIPAFPVFRRRQPAITACALLLAACYLLFHARLRYWHGDWTWGPRYLFVITPLLFLSLGALLESPAWRDKRSLRLAAIGIAGASFLVQLAGISVFYDKYFYDLLFVEKIPFVHAKAPGAPQILEPPPGIYGDWQKAPLLAHLRSLRQFAANLTDYRPQALPAGSPAVEVIRAAPYMHLPDFWWSYQYFHHGNRRALAVPVAGLLLIGYCALQLAQSVRRHDQP